MKNNITELVFILDRSGSMSGLEGDTIGGFNSLINKQKGLEGECYVSTVLFDHEQQVLHDRIPLSDVPPMTEQDYVVRGSTALLDAIGLSIRHISNIHKYARPEDVPSQTMFVITTDGCENASHRYSSEEIKALIGRQKKEHGWEFVFLGANIDAVQTANTFGIAADRAANYHADAEGTRAAYDSMGDMVQLFRGHKSTAGWNKSVSEDYEKREKR